MPLAVDIGVRVNMVPSTVNVVAGVEGSGFKMSPTWILLYRHIKMLAKLVQLKVALSPGHISPGLVSVATAEL